MPEDPKTTVTEPKNSDELFAQIAAEQQDQVTEKIVEEGAPAGTPSTTPEPPAPAEVNTDQVEEIRRLKTQLAEEERQRKAAQTQYFNIQTELNKGKKRGESKPPEIPPEKTDEDPDEHLGQEFNNIYAKHYERLAKKYPDYEEGEIGRRAHAAASEDYLDKRTRHVAEEVMRESPITKTIESTKINERKAVTDVFYKETVLKSLDPEGNKEFLQVLNQRIAMCQDRDGVAYVGGPAGWTEDAWKNLDMPSLAEETFDIVYGRRARLGKLPAALPPAEDPEKRRRQVSVPIGSGTPLAKRDGKGRFILPSRGSAVTPDVLNSLDDDDFAKLISSAGSY